jgi:tripartite-type tricarboxylate transporter receptor subunit TctC
LGARDETSTSAIFASGGGRSRASGRAPLRFGASLSLRQPIIIENNGAAGGTISVGRVARAAPDGYTIGIGQYGNYVLNGAIYPLQYDLLNDFEPVGLIASNPVLIIAKKTAPATDLKELISWLRANPDKVSAGTAGLGSPAHVAGLLFQKTIGARFQFVPYRGNAPAMQDLVAGQIDIMSDSPTNSLPQVRGGLVKAYAVTANSRLAFAPKFQQSMKLGRRDFTFPHGMAFGFRRARRRLRSPSLIPLSLMPWLTKWCVRGSRS